MNPLSANPTKWSNTLNQFVGNLPTNCLNAFDYFVGLGMKGLKHVNNKVHIIFQNFRLLVKATLSQFRTKAKLFLVPNYLINSQNHF